MAKEEEINDILRKLKSQAPGIAKPLWYLRLLSESAREKQDNESLIRLVAERQIELDYRKVIRLPPPQAKITDGEYYLGDVIYPATSYGRFGLREEELNKHILIVGMTGSGKTNLCFQLLRQLGRHGKPFLVFDWKQNYRQLRRFPEHQGLKTLSVGAKNSPFKFNPLIPPRGVDPKHWLAMLVDVIKHSFFVGHGVEYFIRRGIDKLYRDWRVYAGEAVIYPTMADLEKLLSKEFVRGREMLWMSSVKRVLAALSGNSVLGQVVNSREENSIEWLLKEQVVLEMDNLATIEKVFLVESLLLWLYHFRRQEGKSERLKHMILIEEAHHVLSGRKESAVGEETIMESVVRMIREFGEGVIAVDQEPSKLSRSILANTYCKICQNLGSGRDIKVMSECIELGKEERQYIDLLNVGEGIVKLKGRFVEPIRVRFPLVKNVVKGGVGNP